MVRVITFGAFDWFRNGHLRILQRARILGDHLMVSIPTDGLNMSKKGRHPVIPEGGRRDIRHYQADKLVMGHDWTGRFDHLSELCEVIYLSRADGISSTQIIDSVRLRDLR